MKRNEVDVCKEGRRAKTNYGPSAAVGENQWDDADILKVFLFLVNRFLSWYD